MLINIGFEIRKINQKALKLQLYNSIYLRSFRRISSYTENKKEISLWGLNRGVYNVDVLVSTLQTPTSLRYVKKGLVNIKEIRNLNNLVCCVFVYKVVKTETDTSVYYIANFH